MHAPYRYPHDLQHYQRSQLNPLHPWLLMMSRSHNMSRGRRNRQNPLNTLPLSPLRPTLPAGIEVPLLRSCPQRLRGPNQLWNLRWNRWWGYHWKRKREAEEKIKRLEIFRRKLDKRVSMSQRRQLSVKSSTESEVSSSSKSGKQSKICNASCNVSRQKESYNQRVVQIREESDNWFSRLKSYLRKTLKLPGLTGLRNNIKNLKVTSFHRRHKMSQVERRSASAGSFNLSASSCHLGLPQTRPESFYPSSRPSTGASLVSHVASRNVQQVLLDEKNVDTGTMHARLVVGGDREREPMRSRSLQQSSSHTWLKSMEYLSQRLRHLRKQDEVNDNVNKFTLKDDLCRDNARRYSLENAKSQASTSRDIRQQAVAPIHETKHSYTGSIAQQQENATQNPSDNGIEKRDNSNCQTSARTSNEPQKYSAPQKQISVSHDLICHNATQCSVRTPHEMKILIAETKAKAVVQNALLRGEPHQPNGITFQSSWNTEKSLYTRNNKTQHFARTVNGRNTVFRQTPHLSSLTSNLFARLSKMASLPPVPLMDMRVPMLPFLFTTNQCPTCSAPHIVLVPQDMTSGSSKTCKDHTEACSSVYTQTTHAHEQHGNKPMGLLNCVLENAPNTAVIKDYCDRATSTHTSTTAHQTQTDDVISNVQTSTTAHQTQTDDVISKTQMQNKPNLSIYQDTESVEIGSRWLTISTSDDVPSFAISAEAGSDYKLNSSQSQNLSTTSSTEAAVNCDAKLNNNQSEELSVASRTGAAIRSDCNGWQRSDDKLNGSQSQDLSVASRPGAAIKSDCNGRQWSDDKLNGSQSEELSVASRTGAAIRSDCNGRQWSADKLNGSQSQDLSVASRPRVAIRSDGKGRQRSDDKLNGSQSEELSVASSTGAAIRSDGKGRQRSDDMLNGNHSENLELVTSAYFMHTISDMLLVKSSTSVRLDPSLETKME